MAVQSRKRERTSVGRYQLVEKVGSGGIGAVYRARDPQTDGIVAVKVLTAHLAENPVQLDRFSREFRAATKLEHPNVVRALDMGVDGATVYLVTEFVEGVSLGQMIDRQGGLKEDAAVRIITQVAQALHYAHQNKVVHRDVKPDNILIRTDGMVKLADFGLAKDYDDDRGLTRTLSGLGTPHFMAPEQYRDAKNVDTRGDIYSLGATLYAAVTGRVPFDGCASLVALSKKVKGDIPSARELVPSLSERVDAAIRRAMDPDPARRPATCLDFFKLLTARRGSRTRAAVSGPLVVKSDLPTDRRAYVRHAVGVGSNCVIDTGVGGGSQELWPLVVRDVSAGGVGLLLARRFEPGTNLWIELPSGPGTTPRTLPVQVVRVSAEPLGHWAHGCAFHTRLTEGELAAFLTEAARQSGATPRPQPRGSARARK